MKGNWLFSTQHYGWCSPGLRVEMARPRGSRARKGTETPLGPYFSIALGGSICFRGLHFSVRNFSFFLKFNHGFLALTPIQRSN